MDLGGLRLLVRRAPEEGINHSPGERLLDLNQGSGRGKVRGLKTYSEVASTGAYDESCDWSRGQGAAALGGTVWRSGTRA